MAAKKSKLEICQIICEIVYHIGAVILLAASPFIVNSLISKDKQVDIAQAIREDKRELFKDVSTLVSARFYAQYRIIEKIKDTFSSDDMYYKNIDGLDEMFKNYMDSVIDHNIKVRMLEQQIRYVFNEDISRLFLNKDDKEKSDISGLFTSIHKNIIKLRKDSWNKDNYDKKLISELESDKYKLSAKISELAKKMAELTFAKDKIIGGYSL